MSERRENPTTMFIYIFKACACVSLRQRQHNNTLCKFAIRILPIAKMNVKCAQSTTMYARTIRLRESKNFGLPTHPLQKNKANERAREFAIVLCCMLVTNCCAFMLLACHKRENSTCFLPTTCTQLKSIGMHR